MIEEQGRDETKKQVNPIVEMLAGAIAHKAIIDDMVKEGALEPKGPRDFFYSRKISLKNYDPRRQYETEDFAVTHDSFAEARALVQAAVEDRIAELRGVKAHEVKE